MLAVFLTVIYLAIALTPLALLALHSKHVAHAITGECVMDCGICGCSDENRANKSCCCARKRRLQMGRAEAAEVSCCSARSPGPPPPAKMSCCAQGRQHADDDHEHVQNAERGESKTVTVYKCGGPCGKGKLLALGSLGYNELLPTHPIERIHPPHEETRYAAPPHRPTSRHGEPPDPPPKVIIPA